jgi:hypothetical protein
VTQLPICFVCLFFSSCVTYTGADKSLPRIRKETSYSDRIFWVSHILFIIIIEGILLLYVSITRLAWNEIFSTSNIIHREVGRGNDLSAPLYKRGANQQQCVSALSRISWPPWLRFIDAVTCSEPGSDRRLYWLIPSGFTQAASEEAGIFLCGISARFRAMAFPTFFFHPYLFLAVAFQYLE